MPILGRRPDWLEVWPPKFYGSLLLLGLKKLVGFGRIYLGNNSWGTSHLFPTSLLRVCAQEDLGRFNWVFLGEEDLLGGGNRDLGVSQRGLGLKNFGQLWAEGRPGKRKAFGGLKRKGWVWEYFVPLFFPKNFFFKKEGLGGF